MAATVDVALAGCSSLVGESILEALAEVDFPLGQLVLLDAGADAGQKLDFNGHHLPVQPIEEFDFGRVQVALFALPVGLTEEYAAKAMTAGCTVIDTSERFRLDQTVPLLVSGLHEGSQLSLPAGSLVATASPAGVLLASALRPLQQSAGLERLDITLCYPASTAGRDGVEELATQTANLLNARSVNASVFPKQLAFNLLPQVGAVQDNGGSQAEAGVVGELQRLLEPSLSVSITAIQVPVFFGLAATVHLQTRDELPAAAAQQILAAVPGIKVLDEAGTPGIPTPVTEAAGQDEVFLGRLRDDASRAKSLNFWVVADNVRKCAAINAIQLAEQLVRGDS